MVLDGELVVLDEFGRAQFDPLRRRLSMRDPKSIAHAVKVTPAVVFAFATSFLPASEVVQRPSPSSHRHVDGVLVALVIS
jgi:ATP-dependent DNA ligase